HRTTTTHIYPRNKVVFPPYFSLFFVLTLGSTSGSSISEKMRITSTGFGIGTTSPSDKLEALGGNGSYIVSSATQLGINNYTGLKLKSWVSGATDEWTLRGGSTGGESELRIYHNSDYLFGITTAGAVTATLANALSFGAGLSAAGTYNGSAARTVSVDLGPGATQAAYGNHDHNTDYAPLSYGLPYAGQILYVNPSGDVACKNGAPEDVDAAPISHSTNGSTYGYGDVTNAGHLRVGSGLSVTGWTISHPSSDGNLHVPATGTSNNNKVLTAGSTAGSLSWSFVNWDNIDNIPPVFPPSLHDISDHGGLSSHLNSYLKINTQGSFNYLAGPDVLSDIGAAPSSHVNSTDGHPTATSISSGLMAQMIGCF
ncbi:MAG: hypothetical protein ACYC9O_04435, partial [Candidatus Latescibacterota bacterium]